VADRRVLLRGLRRHGDGRRVHREAPEDVPRDTKFEGDAEARQILVRFKEENEIEVGEHVDRISDAEVMEWYTKMYGRGASK